ncbi:MAG: DedA family protein [Leptospira sp.]|nr:DedA family protein [Leptospira sp.]
MKWSEYLENLLQWVEMQDKILIWIFFFFSNLLENVFPPWPGDTVTVFGGFFVAQTEEGNPSGFGMLGLWSSTILGNLAGAFIMYKFGHRFLNFVRHRNFPFKDELYSEEKIESTFAWFRRNAVVVVILSRFSAGIRFFVSIVAGMVHMNILAFTFLFTLAVILWCGLLIYGGYSVGQNWEVILEYLAIYNRIIIIVIGVAISVYILLKMRKKTS